LRLVLGHGGFRRRTEPFGHFPIDLHVKRRYFKTELNRSVIF